MDLNTVKQFISEIGFPVALCCALCFALYRAGSWIAENVLRPLTQTGVAMGSAHIEFLRENTRATQEAGNDIETVLTNQRDYGPKIAAIHSRIIDRNDRTN